MKHRIKVSKEQVAVLDVDTEGYHRGTRIIIQNRRYE